MTGGRRCVLVVIDESDVEGRRIEDMVEEKLLIDGLIDPAIEVAADVPVLGCDVDCDVDDLS